MSPGEHGAIVSEESGVRVISSASLTSDLKEIVHRRDGSVAGELASVAEKSSLEPTVELVDGRQRSGITRRHRPPARLSVRQALPGHRQRLRRAARTDGAASRSSYLLDGWLADQGFIVVSIDGRGTPCAGPRLGAGHQGQPHRVPAGRPGPRPAGARSEIPELDLSRVGIFGWSFGGYFTAMAVTRRPDIYHAGVAGAPVTDWLDYDTHYTERYLGVPTKDPQPYQVSSVLNVAHELRRPLLLIHGTADDNVYFLHSIRLADRAVPRGPRVRVPPPGRPNPHGARADRSARVVHPHRELLLGTTRPAPIRTGLLTDSDLETRVERRGGRASSKFGQFAPPYTKCE